MGVHNKTKKIKQRRQKKKKKTIKKMFTKYGEKKEKIGEKTGNSQDSLLLNTGFNNTLLFKVKGQKGERREDKTKLFSEPAIPASSSSQTKHFLSKSHVLPQLENNHSEPALSTKKPSKKELLKLKDSTTGKQWYDMPAPRMTPELKSDLQIMQMRNVAFPKRFYKTPDKQSKYLQIGTVIEGPAEFHSARLPKSQRKRTITEQLMSDPEFKHSSKKRRRNIEEKQKKLNNHHRHQNKKKKTN
eukprot:c30409_g1_i1.p1 GENE.c30409_g1_i1~~c30409_g1_i1.p1  ORF type:complete len:243 (-),score=57.29 c30409_g1_i1:108-836(-)